MRLGKVQAAGYIEDTEVTDVEDVQTPGQPERTASAPDPEPVITAGVSG